MNGHLLLTGGRVFDGLALIEAGFVEIEGTRIGRVGALADLTSDLGAQVVNCSDCTVLPGLIDTHAHILHQAHALNLSEAAAAIWAVGSLASALAKGVTTVRDLGTRSPAIFGIKSALNSGYAFGPRLLAAGEAICMTGGHGWHELSTEADGSEAVRAAARRQLKRGADLIKVMATGGAGTPGRAGASQLTQHEMQAAAEEAHKAGKPMAAHAIGAEGIRNAIEAGADSIEHGVFLEEPELELMLARKVVLCPTLAIYHRIVACGAAAGTPAFMIEKARAIIGPHRENFRRAVQAGARIVFGTDAGMSYFPVGDVVEELMLMVEAGMTPRAALSAATAAAAVVCGCEERTGRLMSGLAADIIVVEGDALADIAAIGHVRHVYRDGKAVATASTFP